MAHRRGARTDPESRRTACAGFQPGSPGARPRLSCCTGHGAGRSRESSFEAALMGTVSSLGELTPSLAPPPGQFFQFKGFSLYGPEIFPTRNPHQFLPKDLQAHVTFSSTRCQAAMRCLPSASPCVSQPFYLATRGRRLRPRGGRTYQLCPSDGMTLFHSFSFSISMMNLFCIRYYD